MAVAFWDIIETGYEEDFGRNTNPWDRLVLNGLLVPGLASVKVTPKIRIDLVKSSSVDGGPTIERGHEAAKVDITIKLWTPLQWEVFQRVLEATWRRPGQKLNSRDGDEKKAIQIYHPACALYGVTAVLIESPSSPDPAPERGAMVVTLKCVQYIAPSKKDATKKANGAGVARAPELGGAKNTPNPKPPSQTQALARDRLPPDQGDE